MIWLALTFVVTVTVVLTFGLGRMRHHTLGGRTRMRTLAEELAWLRSYADVLRAKHGNELRFHWAITPAAARTLFPRFVLQPLLEEAVRHGLENGRRRCEISVHAALAGGRGHEKTLVCTVEDDVPAGRPSAADSLQPLRRMLTLQCRHARFRVEGDTKGTRAIVELPHPDVVAEESGATAEGALERVAPRG
jgi:LytS/YehU family sensor histidine kinase